MKNPEWEKAETERLSAEDAYAKFMKDPATLLMREDEHAEYARQMQALNDRITKANRQVRITPEEV